MGKMPENVPVLDLASLPERFPNAGKVLFRRMAPDAIKRLRPSITHDSTQAEILVERLGRQDATPMYSNVIISWHHEELADDYINQLSNVVNDHDLTESAAIVVMALLLSHYESIRSLLVSKIGLGADYKVTIPSDESFALEVSGINIAKDSHAPRQRLHDKTRQLLKLHHQGYVSVTAFQCTDGSRQSLLHFVSRSSGPDNRGEKSMNTGFDNRVESSNLSMEGEVATRMGETNKACELHNRAGELLMKEADAADSAAQQHFSYLLAATQYFLAGNYSRARSVSAAIKRTKIPERYRRAVRGLVATAHDRARADYAPRIRQKCVEEWKKHDYRAVMKLLAENPYVYPQDVMAYIRSVVGAELGQYAASAQYMKQSLKYGLKDQGLLFRLMHLPFVPLQRGNLEAALVHAQKAMTILPHAGTYLIGAFVLHQLAWQSNGTGQNEWIPKLLECGEMMEKLLPEAPEDFQSYWLFREFLDLTRKILSLYKSNSGSNRSIQEVIPSELQARYNLTVSKYANAIESDISSRLAS